MENNNTQPTNQDILDAVNRMDTRFNELENNTNLILQSINQFSTATDQRFNRLETGQEEIKLRLGNKANVMDLEALEQRVDLLTTN